MVKRRKGSGVDSSKKGGIDAGKGKSSDRGKGSGGGERKRKCCNCGCEWNVYATDQEGDLCLACADEVGAMIKVGDQWYKAKEVMGVYKVYKRSGYFCQ